MPDGCKDDLVLGAQHGLHSGRIGCQSHLSGNGCVIWTDDNQIGPNIGSLGLHIHAGRHNIESFRLDVDSLQSKPFERQNIRPHHDP